MTNNLVQDNSILSVSELNRAVAGMLTRTFPLLTVRGEISNFTRASSGHWYFTLKDAQAQVRAVMFKGRAQFVDWQPREGERVEVRATVNLYEARGDFQLGVEAMRRAGVGDLYAEFLRIKEQLAAAGLFDSAHKLAIPLYPRALGIITSPQAAALHDVIQTLQRRAPQVALVIYPVPVQGMGAAEKITAMVQIANQRREVDTLLLVRGGGSIEDLWAFNDAALARAIAASHLPIISGIGHETDFTIADFVASRRAPTPTAAAELAVPERAVVRAVLDNQARHLTRAMQQRLHSYAQQLDGWQRDLLNAQAWFERWQWRLQSLQQRLQHTLSAPLQAARWRLQKIQIDWESPSQYLARQQPQLIQLEQGLRTAWQANMLAQQLRLSRCQQALQLLNPHAVLARGYSLVLDQRGQVVTTAAALQPQQGLTLKFVDGQARVQVEEVESQPDASD